MPSKDELEKMILEYGSWYKNYGDSHEAVGWNKPKNIDRFEQLLHFWNDELPNKKIIDLGCGLAHLAGFIEMRNLPYGYTGIDINSNYIEINRSKFPQYEFHCYGAADLANSADFIVASGLFNRKFNDSPTFLRETVKKMIDNSVIGCSFNCLSSTAMKKHSQNYYVSMGDVEEIIDRTLLDGFVIDGDSIPGELTVHLRKKC